MRQRRREPYGSPRRASRLDGLEDWLQEWLLRQVGSAGVVRQELLEEHGMDV